MVICKPDLTHPRLSQCREVPLTWGHVVRCPTINQPCFLPSVAWLRSTAEFLQRPRAVGLCGRLTLGGRTSGMGSLVLFGLKAPPPHLLAQGLSLSAVITTRLPAIRLGVTLTSEVTHLVAVPAHHRNRDRPLPLRFGTLGCLPLTKGSGWSCRSICKRRSLPLRAVALLTSRVSP